VTIDHHGRPTVSYKGGDPGFVRVLDGKTVALPCYDGNGMFYSMGNLLGNPQVGMLFVISKTHTERLIQTCNQHLVVERFGKKTGRASRERLCTRFYFRKSGQENDRQMMTLGNQFTLQFHPIHARHLHVTDQAIGVMQAVRFQERVSGCKLDNCISQRSNEAHCRVAKRVVIIDNCDHGDPRQLSLQFNNLASIVKEPNR